MACSAAFWQVDDAGRATAELLRPVAFATIETSEGNYQLWLAVTDEAAKKELDAARARLLEAVKRTGGNGGSYGAVRLPGTLNRKRDPAPQVRLIHSSLGRAVTVAELEESGLLAAPPEPKQKPRSNVVPMRERGWPSYERALADVDPKEDGEPDRSDADYLWCLLAFGRGHKRAEVRAEFLRVSESAASKSEEYLERTLGRAEEAARR